MLQQSPRFHPIIFKLQIFSPAKTPDVTYRSAEFDNYIIAV